MTGRLHADYFGSCRQRRRGARLQRCRGTEVIFTDQAHKINSSRLLISVSLSRAERWVGVMNEMVFVARFPKLSGIASGSMCCLIE